MRPATIWQRKWRIAEPDSDYCDTITDNLEDVTLAAAAAARGPSGYVLEAVFLLARGVRVLTQDERGVDGT